MRIESELPAVVQHVPLTPLSLELGTACGPISVADPLVDAAVDQAGLSTRGNCGPTAEVATDSSEPSGPLLESVRFPIPDGSPAPLCSPTSRRHVTLSRGSLDPLPIHFFEGVGTPVKEKVADFITYVRRTPAAENRSQAIVASPPPRRRARALPELPTPLRRSERLARKSRHRATKPALQAQNVMMKRLGITSASCPPDATSFQRYTATFSSTLTTSQCDALDVLLPGGYNLTSVAATSMSP